jgi:predicted GNAT family acetyltransferase
MEQDLPMIDHAQPVTHNEAAQRFETHVQGQLARADYRLADGVMHLYHTEVPVQFEGRGIAALLVHAAMAHARAHGLKVRPACSYVRTFMARFPQYGDLRA